MMELNYDGERKLLRQRTHSKYWQHGKEMEELVGSRKPFRMAGYVENAEAKSGSTAIAMWAVACMVERMEREDVGKDRVFWWKKRLAHMWEGVQTHLLRDAEVPVRGESGERSTLRLPRPSDGRDGYWRAVDCAMMAIAGRKLAKLANSDAGRGQPLCPGVTSVVNDCVEALIHVFGYGELGKENVNTKVIRPYLSDEALLQLWDVAPAQESRPSRFVWQEVWVVLSLMGDHSLLAYRLLDDMHMRYIKLPADTEVDTHFSLAHGHSSGTSVPDFGMVHSQSQIGSPVSSPCYMGDTALFLMANRFVAEHDSQEFRGSDQYLGYLRRFEKWFFHMVDENNCDVPRSFRVTGSNTHREPGIWANSESCLALVGSGNDFS
jgi:hypothetical protein